MRERAARERRASAHHAGSSDDDDDLHDLGNGTSRTKLLLHPRPEHGRLHCRNGPGGLRARRRDRQRWRVEYTFIELTVGDPRPGSRRGRLRGTTTPESRRAPARSPSTPAPFPSTREPLTTQARRRARTRDRGTPAGSRTRVHPGAAPALTARTRPRSMTDASVPTTDRGSPRLARTGGTSSTPPARSPDAAAVRPDTRAGVPRECSRASRSGSGSSSGAGARSGKPASLRPAGLPPRTWTSPSSGMAPSGARCWPCA